MRLLNISFFLIVFSMTQISIAKDRQPDDRIVFSASIQSKMLKIDGSGHVEVQQLSQSSNNATGTFDPGELQTEQSLLFTGKDLASVSSREGECLIEVQFPWQNSGDKVRSLLDIKFNSGDKTGLALIGDTLQLYGWFDGVYRHAFFRGLHPGPDSQALQLVLSWIYADGYTLVTLRINDDEVASLVSGLGKGEVQSIELAGRSGTGKSELGPVIWQRLELSQAIRWQALQTTEKLPVSAQLLQNREGLTLWTESATRQVRLKQVLPDMPLADHASLSLAKGETHALQLVLTSENDLDNVSITSSGWQDVHGQPLDQTVCNQLKLELRWVEHVKVAFPSGRFGGSGMWPDPLPLIKGAVQVPARENRAVWLSVQASRNMTSGLYHTWIHIQHGKQSWRVPLHVKVRQFVLPKRLTMDTVARLNSRFLPEGQEELYYRNLSEHRINGLIGAPTIERLVSPNMTSDELRQAKAHTNLLVNELHFDHVSLSVIGWVTHKGTHVWPDESKWGTVPHFKPADSATINPRFKHSFLQHIQKLTHQLSSVADMQRFMFFYQDEMSWNDSKTLERSVNIARFLKQVAPEIPILQSKYPTPELNAYVDFWCVHADHAVLHDASLREVQRQGAKVWVYHNTIPVIDYPSIRSRLFPWLLRKLGYDGSYSYWSVNEWLEDPWQQAWSGIAGSGVLLYPPREKDGQGPVNSIRWEMLRDGLEDVEYLHLLEQVLTQEGIDAQQASRIRMLLKQSQEMVEKLPRVIGLGDQPYCLDVVKLENLRNAIGDVLDELAR